MLLKELLTSEDFNSCLENTCEEIEKWRAVRIENAETVDEINNANTIAALFNKTIKTFATETVEMLIKKIGDTEIK